MESKQYINKQERNDANNIVMRSIIYSFIPSFLIVYTGHAKLCLGIILILAMLLIKNYNDIYIKYNDKYKAGNSYIKRKFRTVGVFITLYFYATFYLSYIASHINLIGAFIFYILTLIILFISYGRIINVIWYNFDLSKYKEIDEKNPYQKRYTTQSKKQWSKK